MSAIRLVAEDLRRDLRHALRSIARSPGFATAVILTLGLGIGANAAMFGVVDRLMFRPYERLRDPGAVHRVYLTDSDARGTYTNSYFAYTRYLDLRRWMTTASDLAGFADRELAVGVGENAREHRVATVSAEFFTFFDAPPALGRYFTPEEDTPPRGAEVSVLGFDFWQSEYGGRDVRGEELRIGGMRTTIIGVAARGFAGVADDGVPVAYIPITAYAAAQRFGDDAAMYYRTYNWSWMQVMARRKPGVSADQMSADLEQAYRRSWEAEVATERRLTPIEVARPTGIAAPLRPGAGPEPGLEARTALWVTGVSLIVLLIACANVANLFLARALRRQRETAVRVALGVSRERLLRQALTESVVLAALGGLAGLLIAQWGGAGIRSLLVGRAASAIGGGVLTDTRTLLVAGAVALGTGLLTGLAPVLFARDLDLASSLKSGAREGTHQRSRTRTALLVTQFALSFLLLVGAGLFVRSLSNVRELRLGFDAPYVLVVERNLREVVLDDSGSVRLTRTLLEAAQAYPGVEAAAAVNSIPFWSSSSRGLYVTGIDSVRKLGRFTYQSTTPDYFRTMGTRILRGRGISDDDRAGAERVVVMSEAMAGVLWPGKEALGECIRIGADTMPCSTVIGIAENMIQRDLSDPQVFHYYVPLTQMEPARSSTLFLRLRGDPVAQQEGVRRTLQRLMPGDGYITTMPLADVVQRQQRSWELGATMFVAFGVLALLVAAIGLYGVIGYNVTQRMHELGVRIALGARDGHILRLVIGQSLRLALIGIAAGIALALVASRWMEPLLFRQSARDLVVYAAVSGLLLLVTVAASAAPAWRAIRADPNAALRTD